MNKNQSFGIFLYYHKFLVRLKDIFRFMKKWNNHEVIMNTNTIVYSENNEWYCEHIIILLNIVWWAYNTGVCACKIFVVFTKYGEA